MRFLMVLLLTPLALVYAGEASDEMLQERLKAHIEFLAADELRGRQPGTQGYQTAANYVADQFARTGMTPAGDSDSYFQQVPLRRAWLQEGSARMSLQRDGAAQKFEFAEQFYIAPGTGHTSIDMSAGMIFAGYGVHAPELGYSDFDQLDVKGKVVVTLGGRPAGLPGEEGAHFGSSQEKSRALAAHGAVGWITIFTPRNEKLFAWDQLGNRIGMPSMAWLQKDGTPFAAAIELQARATLHHEAASAMFDGAPYSLGELLEMDRLGDGLPLFPLAGTVSLAHGSRHETIHSPNVVGLLPGNDPSLAGEYLLYIAHLDHIGELAGGGHRDVVNNGALDNAAGVSVMLETARLLGESGKHRRSLLFLAATAEEQGLAGSEFYAQNPTVSIDAVVGAVNLDMPVLLYEFGDVIAFGAEHSTLGAAAEEAAGNFGTRLGKDPFPERNIFVRSDHYRFVQQGVPSIFLMPGPSSIGGDGDRLQVFEKFLEQNYHQPSDDLALPIHYGAAARFTRINAGIGEIVANQASRPRWREGNFFGTSFKR